MQRERGVGWGQGSRTMAVRRLRQLQCALVSPASGPAAAEAGGPDEDWAFAALAQGQLHPSSVTPPTLRRLMQPQPDGPTETERIMGSLPPDIELGAPPKRLLDGSGGVTEATLSWLRSLEATAAGSARYERAAYIRDLIEVIRPRPKLTALECAPDTLEEQAQFFFENGACLTPFLPPVQVALR